MYVINIILTSIASFLGIVLLLLVFLCVCCVYCLVKSNEKETKQELLPNYNTFSRQEDQQVQDVTLP